MKYATTPCLTAGCHNIAIKEGRCEQHQRPTWVGKNVRRSAPPKDWQTRRRIAFTRDNYICYICGSNTPVADTIDHVDGNADNNDLNNLKPVHDINAPHCHRKKTRSDQQNKIENNKIKYNKYYKPF